MRRYSSATDAGVVIGKAPLAVGLGWPRRRSFRFGVADERVDWVDDHRAPLLADAVGRLAGCISHDFNELLSAILGYGDLLISDLKANDPTCAHL